MLWVNLIMDTLASLALATEEPTEELLNRTPHSRDEYIISPTMLKHILGQAIFQLIVMITLVFCGEQFIPEYVDSYDSTIFANNPAGKWLNGVVGGTVRSGRFFTIKGEDDYVTVFDENKVYSRHYTFIFNTFVFMTIFNFVNARKLYEEVIHPLFSSTSSKASPETPCSPSSWLASSAFRACWSLSEALLSESMTTTASPSSSGSSPYFIH
jgi:Ca2+ transporting ATPase